MGISEDFPTISFFMVSSCFYMHSRISARGFVSWLACWFFQWLICPTISSSIREIVKHCKKMSRKHPPFLGSGPKGPMSCKTQGEFPDVCPSFHPSFYPPYAQQDLKFALPALNLALQASNQLSRLQISPPPTSNLTSRSDLRSAFQTFN